MHKSFATVIPKLFWIAAAITIVIWAASPGYVAGWDLNVYKNAIQALRAGLDPYAAGTAIQRLFHAHLAEHPNAPTPFTYVYSPVTLPLLRLVGRLPFAISGLIYWTLYALATLAVIWVSSQFLTRDERKVFKYLTPAAVFFPGLLQQDVIFSGNVAYIIYGFVFVTAYIGITRSRWLPFYIVVLVASCIKAPLLIFLAIPFLSDRRQAIYTAVTALIGVCLFAVQPHLWPGLFRNYLDAVELQFSFNHDFSSSPSGLLADALYNVVPYKITSLVFYLFYAIPTFLALWHLGRRYQRGDFARKQWAPVVFCGTAFMNPRIMEYDVAPMTIFLALIIWRAFAKNERFGQTALKMAIFFAIINGFAITSWRPTESLVLTGIFATGAIGLWRRSIHEHIANIRSVADLSAEQRRMPYVVPTAT